MFPSFIGILDIQSWWEVPSIAYFCSLFRTAFNLLDFDIEELEEALLTDGSEECASTLLTELIVRLLNGCLGNNDISAFNYQMFLRRLFRQKCQETGRSNPFNNDIDFQFLPLRTKVEILYALCDFRLDAEDVFELFKNLDAESLRVEPLGWDDNSSAYWYFYGTRLYREDYKPKSKSKKKRSKDEKRSKEERRRRKLFGNEIFDDQDMDRVWQVVCFTEADWTHLTDKFKSAASTVEKELYQSLSENFLPEIPRLFQEKERLQRKRLLELAPRRTSTRVLQKIKQKEEEDKSPGDARDSEATKEDSVKKEKVVMGREHRAQKRDQLRSKSASSESSDESSATEKVRHQKESKKATKSNNKKSKSSSLRQRGEQSPAPPEPPVKTGRKTNNSLACATGQIVIPDTVEPSNSNSTRKILKTSQIFSPSEEDVQTDMYKVLEQLIAHEDAWPFMDPVDEEYAPNYYTVIRRPMDLKKMEERLDSGFYTDFSAFQSDFKLIVNNCRLYNGQDNEYTHMVGNLQDAYDRLTKRYIDRVSSSDEEIAVEYPIPTPSRKHKLKADEESSLNPKKSKRTFSNSDNPPSSTECEKEKDVLPTKEEKIKNQEKDARKSKDGKMKKKHKTHHHHSKHSRSHKKTSDRKAAKKELKYLRKLKHQLKKEKHRKRKLRHSKKEPEVEMKRSSSRESLESSNRSRSASPLPSIHSNSQSPSPSQSPSSSASDQLNDPDFFKDKYDKIKERRRQNTKDNWDKLTDYKHKNLDKQKQNLSVPDKDKNQKLRETIEKLKAKNERYKEALIFNNLFSGSSQTNVDKSNITSETLDEVMKTPLKKPDHYEFIEESDQGSKKSQSAKMSKDKELNPKKAPKKVSAAKNESATMALNQAVKDISKWLDDAPKPVSRNTPSNSPAQTISTEEHDSRLEDDFSITEKTLVKKDVKKRPPCRELKIPSRRREIQRIIERLQPGKSKGNLIANATSTKLEEVIPLGPHNKTREIKSVLTTKVDDLSPKLSLGSVLPAVGFTLGKDHKFSEEERKEIELPKIPEIVSDVVSEDATLTETSKTEPVFESAKAENKVMKEAKEIGKSSPKFSQEKVTPNLSAWFKAFGAPKSTPTVPNTKKKNEDTELDEKQQEAVQSDNKMSSPKNVLRYDSPPDEISPTPEGGDSPIANVTATPRQRRTSTGSSVSERSSFSQDLDSPRHQVAHSSPLLRSPASPRTDEFQKITYPIINGTVRAGFYQDTASIKSSPEKSCSPRDAPQSPYSPYSQHVYALNNAAVSASQSYYVDQNKSPVPTYGLNQPPPYYDSSKAPVIHKQSRINDDYTALGPEVLYQQNLAQLGPYSPAPSPYSQHSQHSPYSHVQNSPQTVSQISHPDNSPVPETKTSLYPVKKRAYHEELSPSKSKQDQDNTSNDVVEHTKSGPSKDEYQKIVQSINTLASELAPTSVDDIALALSKKSDAIKINTIKESSSIAYMDRLNVERHDASPNYNGNINPDDTSKQSQLHNTIPIEKHSENVKSGSLDMINMGYLVSELERRSDISDADLLNATRDLQKSKGFDMGTMAMNLGMNKAPANKYSQSSKLAPKGNVGVNMEKMHNELMNQNILEYDNIQAANQSVSNFSLSDFELTSKKFYSGATVRTNASLDYGNWKTDSQLRKTDSVHSNFQNNYPVDNTELNKIKSNVNISNPNVGNYSKTLHSQQLQALAGTRAPMLRGAVPHNMPSELRIPNPRGVMKSDYMGDVAISDSDIMGRNVEGHAQKSEKPKQNQASASSLQYKPPFSNHSSIPLDTLRNIPNLPQMLERYSNDEIYLAGFGASSSSLYHDKSLQMAQMFNKSLPSEAHSSSSSAIYSQASAAISKDNMSYKASSTGGQLPQADKTKQRRKKTAETKHSPMPSSQSYHSQACTSDVLTSVKTSLVPGSAFNFGPSAGMGLSGSLYSESSGFSLEDFRNTTANQFMAANYMVAAAAAHQRNTSDANVEKIAKPAHQNTPHSSSGTFPFIGHGQVRAGYPFVGADSSSPLYQQYLQRHQEEILRQTGAQIMGLYPPGYHPGNLGARQPYDSINRPPWL